MASLLSLHPLSLEQAAMETGAPAESLRQKEKRRPKSKPPKQEKQN